MYCQPFRKVLNCLGLFLTVLFFSSIPAAQAQAVYGSVFGTIRDNTGAVIPNANITVSDVAKGTSVTTVSGAGGEYLVQHLIPDTYRVDVEATGFTKGTTDNVVVFADTSPKVDLQLSVAGASNTVIVTGSGAPAPDRPGRGQHHLE